MDLVELVGEVDLDEGRERKGGKVVSTRSEVSAVVDW